MGLWTKGAEKYPNFGYLDNGCYGNQKTPSELIKRLKGCRILAGKVLDWKKIVAMALCYHDNRNVVMATYKRYPCRSFGKMCVNKMSLWRHWWLGTVMSHWLLMMPWSKKATLECQETSSRSQSTVCVKRNARLIPNFFVAPMGEVDQKFTWSIV